MSIIPVICYQYLQNQAEERRKKTEEERRNNTNKVDDKSEYLQDLYSVPIREFRSAYIQLILNEKKGGTRL